MTDIACPSCGGAVRFGSSLSVSAVCPYCQTLVVRRDVDVEAMGKVADLPQDMSPFQIGTQAYDGKTAIGLMGRVRLAWADGYWNEWFFVGDDGRKGWLAEAQGTYALSYESEKALHSNTVNALNRMILAKPNAFSGMINQELTLDGTPYRLTDRKDCICVGCEGELPIVSPRGRKSLMLDFMGAPEAFASVEAVDNELSVFVGRYVEWDDLRASNLKPVEGWT